jgi:hypothetical protein
VLLLASCKRYRFTSAKVTSDENLFVIDRWLLIRDAQPYSIQHVQEFVSLQGDFHCKCVLERGVWLYTEVNWQLPSFE